MALTKIGGGVLKQPIDVGIITATSLNASGIVTAGTVQVGAATTIHTTGIDLGSGNVTSHNINSTGIITATSFVGPVTGNVTGNTSGTASNLSGSPSINVTNITASGNVSIAGTLTYEDVTNIDSVGIITAQSDVSIADKIVHTGDTDTVIRFPANDTFTVETGGTERARVNSGGVLLGLTTAVGEGGTPADLNSTEIGRGFINLSRDNTAAADHILFGKNGSIAASMGTDTTNTLVFKTGTTERVRITSTGLLDVSGGIQVSENITPTSGSGIEILKASSTVGLIQAYNRDSSSYMDFRLRGNQIELFTAGSEALRVDSNGFIGIGENSPSSYDQGARQLVVKGSTNAGMTIRSATNKSGSLYFADGTTGNEAYRGRIEYNHTDDRLQLGTAGTGSKVIIDSSGRLLLGTTTEGEGNADDLTVATSGHTGITIRSGTANRGNIYFSDGTSGDSEYRGYVTYDHDGDKLKLGTANADRLLINSDGNVGINQTSPNKPLSFATAVGQKIELYNSGSNNEFGIGVQSSELRICSGASSDIAFRTGGYNGSERLRITSGGHIISGNLSINGSVNTDNTTVSGYTQVQSDNHANTFFGQNLKLGANSGSGDHTLRIINQHSSIGGAGMLIGGNGSGRQNSINFYAESANQVPTTEVQANARMTINSSAVIFTSSGQPRNQYASAQSYLRTFGFTFNLQDGQTETLFYNPDGYRRIYYEMWIQSGHGSNGYGYLFFNSSRYGTSFHDADWHVAYTTYAHSGTVNGNVNHNGIKFSRSGGGGSYTQVTYYCIVKAYSPAGGNPFGTSGLTDPSYRFYSHGF